MILGFPDRFQIFFVLALVLDQGGDGKPCDGKPESTVSAGSAKILRPLVWRADPQEPSSFCIFLGIRIPDRWKTGPRFRRVKGEGPNDFRLSQGESSGREEQAGSPPESTFGEGDVTRDSRLWFFGQHFCAQTDSFEDLNPFTASFADLYLFLFRFAIF